MASLTHYYNRARGGLVGINPEEAYKLFVEDYAIIAGTGALLGLVSASVGGLDKHVAGMPLPLDGAASVALGLASLSINSPELKIASIAAGGSAAVRTFEKFFKKTIAHGELDSVQEQFGFGHQYQLADHGADYGYGWGSETDSILATAEAL